MDDYFDAENMKKSFGVIQRNQDKAIQCWGHQTKSHQTESSQLNISEFKNDSCFINSKILSV